MNKTGEDVAARLAAVTPAARRREAVTMTDLLRATTGDEPEMWSGGIIGFGSCHYRYPTGHEGDSPIVGFAPRKNATTVYLLDGIDAHRADLAELGPHTTGVGCLYLKSLEDVDLIVLERIVRASYAQILRGVEGFAKITVTS